MSEDMEARQWALTRWVIRYRVAFLLMAGLLVVSAVAGVAGKVSWGHIVHVGHMVGEPDAAWLPVAIDGTMIAGAIMAAIDRLRGFRPRFWSTVALWLGAALTLTYNVVSAWERGFWGCVVAVTPGLSLLVLVEGLTRPGRVKAAVQDAARAVVAAVQAAVAPAPVLVPVPVVAPVAPSVPVPAVAPVPAPVVVPIVKAPVKRAPRKVAAKPLPAKAAVPAKAAPAKRATRRKGPTETGPRPTRTLAIPSVDTALAPNGRPTLTLVPAFQDADGSR